MISRHIHCRNTPLNLNAYGYEGTVFRVSIFKNGNVRITKQCMSYWCGSTGGSSQYGGLDVFLVIEDNIPFPEEFTEALMALIPANQNTPNGLLTGEVECRFRVLEKMKEGLAKLYSKVEGFQDQIENMNQEIESLKRKKKH